MKEILFIHSGGPQGPSTGSGPLVAALQTALGAEYNLLHPPMPAPESPAYEPWKNALAAALAPLSGPVILVGHSLGGSVLVKYLAEAPSTPAIAGLFLIAAPFWGGDENWQYEQFLLREDTAATLPDIARIFLYHSRDDAVVPFAHLALYAATLSQATARALDGYGHGFTSGAAELVRDISAVGSTLEP